MSRLIDKLNQTSNYKPQPMGFMASQSSTEKARIRLIALLKEDDPGVKGSDALAIEVSDEKGLERLQKELKEQTSLPVGARINTADDRLRKKIFETDCDFLIFGDNTPVAWIPEEKVGRILELRDELSDIMLNTIDDMPVDAAVVKIDSQKVITLDTLMQLQRVISLTDCQIVIETGTDYEQTELQVLWNLGISGLLVNGSEHIEAMKEKVQKLKSPSKRKKDKTTALLPRISPQSTEPCEEEEEEDD
jgi:hypothetical protein